MPHRASVSRVSCSFSTMVAFVTKRAASINDLCVDRCTTRKPGVINIVAVHFEPVRRARIS